MSEPKHYSYYGTCDKCGYVKIPTGTEVKMDYDGYRYSMPIMCQCPTWKERENEWFFRKVLKWAEKQLGIVEV